MPYFKNEFHQYYVPSLKLFPLPCLRVTAFDIYKMRSLQISYIRQNSALKITERRLVELLREETEKVVARLYTAFENYLKGVFSGNVRAVTTRVIKNGKHLADSFQERRDSKQRRFGRQMSFKLVKFVNGSDRGKQRICLQKLFSRIEKFGQYSV